MRYPQLIVFQVCYALGNVLMLLNGTWRQHNTLTSNMAHTGHTRALDTEREGQVTHGVGFHIYIYGTYLSYLTFTPIASGIFFFVCGAQGMS